MNNKYRLLPTLCHVVYATKGFITFDYAFDVYGVAIRNNSGDTEATATRRAELAAAKSDKPAYLKHFHQSVGIDPNEHKPAT
jgi:hypothetical protein